MIIIVADAECEYVDALSDQLARKLNDMQIIGCCCLDDWSEFLSKYAAESLSYPGKTDAGRPIFLCLFNPVDFPDLPQRFCRANPLLNCTFRAMNPGRPDNLPPGAPDQPDTLYRLGSVSKLVDFVRCWADSNTAAVREETNSHGRCEYPSALLVAENGTLAATLGNDSSAEPQSGIHLLLSIEASGYRPEVSRLRLRELVNSGRKVIYLPLMPTYQMCCLSPPGLGPTLSDLLLQLPGQTVTPDLLGQYMQPHPDGYLQFRPPDRSDDLVLCNPDLLRSLIGMLRKRIMHDLDPFSVLVDCAGIPLASVACIAVLCDSCEVCLPDKECYATTAARREASHLLALLPSGCQVRENKSGLPATTKPASYAVTSGRFSKLISKTSQGGLVS
jgi:hypothetical protein